jgi:lycopene cyclase CruA
MFVLMQELLYLEVPTPDTATVCIWLQQTWQTSWGKKIITPDGIRLQFVETDSELAIFTWSLQRTTYMKMFQWGKAKIKNSSEIKQNLIKAIRKAFPPSYPVLPAVDLSKQSIFAALADYYPQTVKFFQKIPNGEYDLNRVYWWEQRWRESVRNPQQPKQVVFNETQETTESDRPEYDMIYIGGALGAIHAAVMAKLGYRVLLIERLRFGRMNREWNISRSEFQSLIDLGLFTKEEFESIIATEYIDGFSKFFDSYNPPHLKAAILSTPTVLNVAIETDRLLGLCREKLEAAGCEIWDETEFIRARVGDRGVTVELAHLLTGELRQARGRLLIDAMGTASPIAWQLNGTRTFNSVCPTVGAVIQKGIATEVWNPDYGDVLNSHGDISRGRQLIWELFPGSNNELTVYLFHYHQVHPENPGSLLEMYEDFFTILPEYRRCDLENLEWRKATFGYIPGHYSTGEDDRTVAFDRLLAIGDAASLQSPLVFTGFGSLVRNLKRLTTLLDTALRHDLWRSEDLDRIRAYQSNIAVTWLFSKGMMVPTGKILPPERINAMLNTFFGLLATEPPEVADTFIKDRFDWLTFNRLALKAASKNPMLIVWIWEMAGLRDLLLWLGSYLAFTLDSAKAFLLKGWFPAWLDKSQAWLEGNYPRLWLRLLSLRWGLSE